MGDDLSAFFAKKKAKDKKKKGVVNLDDMGQHLERKAKRQEERDRVEAEEDKHTQDDDTFIKKTASEESEWLDYNEDFGQNRLEGLGIKVVPKASPYALQDMNLTEQTEAESQEEAVDSEGTVPVETVKTWNVPESKQAAPEIIPTASELEAAKQHTRPVGGKYVPPSSRQRTEQTVRPRLDVNNQEMFPTIAAADQIEKIKKDEEKKKVEQPAAASGTYVAPRAPWANVNSGRDVNSGREDAMNAARALAATASASTPPPRAPEPAPQAAPANPNRYIPPHLRNKT